MDLSNLGQIIKSPIGLGVIGFIGIILFVFCGFTIYIWLKQRFSKFGKSQERYQKCIAVTANFKLAYFDLEVMGSYVFNKITNSWHMLDSDALVPNLDTGEFYLPIDERDAIPLFPLKDNAFRETKVAELEKNIDQMAEDSAMQVIYRRQLEKKKEEDTGRRNFALAAVFGILALIVAGVIAKSFM